MATLTENPELRYLNELSTDIDGSCQEMRGTVLCPLKYCAKLLQPFHITQRGRDILAVLNQTINYVEQMIAHWEIQSSEIAEFLRGEREDKPHKEPIAIG